MQNQHYRFQTRCLSRVIIVAIIATVVGCDRRTTVEREIERAMLLKDIGLSPEYGKSVSSNIEVGADRDHTTSESDNSIEGVRNEPKIRIEDLKSPWIASTRLPRDLWEIQYVGNMPVGFLHRKSEVSKTQGNDVFRMELDSRIQSVDSTDPRDSKISISTIERNNGELIGIQGFYQVNDERRSFEGIVAADRLRFKSKAGGHDRSHDVPWKAEYRGPFAIEQSIIRMPLKDKEIREIKYFDPIQANIVEARLEGIGAAHTAHFNG